MPDVEKRYDDFNGSIYEENDKEKGTKFVEQELPAIVERARIKSRKTVVAAFIDVDDLTKINKKHGLKVGDIVLEVILDEVRRGSAARYKGRCGDDTFYAILFDSSKAELFCEKIRRNVKSYEWARIVPGLRATCTIGYSILKDGESPSNFLIRAILGMLEGKERGGDIVQKGPLFSGKEAAIEEPEAKSKEVESPQEGQKEKTVKPSKRQRYNSISSNQGFSLRGYFS